MKIYRGRIYVLDSNVSRLEKRYLYGNYYYCDINRIARKLKVSESLKVEEKFGERIFLEKGSITVFKLPFGRVKCVQTGIVFPIIKIVEQEEKDYIYRSFLRANNRQDGNPYCYYLSKSNCRLYVKIEEELNGKQVQSFYEDLTEEKIKNEINRLERLISEQSQYQKEKPLSNRQYVKKIEQMRNNIKK